MTMASGMFAEGIRQAKKGDLDYDTATIKAALVTNTYTPNFVTHDFFNDVTNEVTGTGYTAGGATLASVAVTIVAANSWSRTWAVATAYLLGQLAIPTTPNGFVYRAIVAGTSHATTEPTWPTTRGATVVDQGVTWQCAGVAVVMVDAADPAWTTSTITARGLIIYKSTGSDATSPLIAAINFGSDVSSTAGTFTAQLPLEGFDNTTI